MTITLTNAQVEVLISLATEVRDIMHSQRLSLQSKPNSNDALQRRLLSDNAVAGDAAALILGKLNIAFHGTPNPKQYT